MLEADDFERSASVDDKRLIKLYLPSLVQEVAQRSPSQSVTECQWRPPRMLNKQQAARIIGQHVFEHFCRVPFTDIVKEASCGSKPESIEELHACATRIYHEYQSSEGRRQEYARDENVRFFDQSN